MKADKDIFFDVESKPVIICSVSFDNGLNLVKQMRCAVERFLDTADGKRMIIETNNDFNWGDALLKIPDKFWNDFGIEINSVQVVEDSLHLDHDEVLCKR